MGAHGAWEGVGMSNDLRGEIRISALCNGIADLAIASAPDPRVAVLILEVALCAAIAQCVHPEDIGGLINGFPGRASRTIADLRLALNETETEH